MSITVNFNGICVFVSATTITLPEGVQQRVVLPNVTNGLAGGIRINPHFAVMNVDGKGYEPLAGRAWITPTAGSFSGDLSSLPNLTNLVAPVDPLGAPSRVVAEIGIDEFVSSYFDIFSGALTSAVVNQTALSTLELAGTGPFTLNIQPFYSAEVETMPIAATLEIANISKEEMGMMSMTGSDPFAALRHFLLHYNVATMYPPAPQLPTLPLDLQDISGSLGCSNSTYP